MSESSIPIVSFAPHMDKAHFDGAEVEYGAMSFACVVKISDEAIDKIADAVVRKLRDAG